MVAPNKFQLMPYRAQIERGHSAEYAWYKAIVDPFGITGIRQPSMFPLSSAVTRLHGVSTLTVGAGGNTVFVLSPVGMQDLTGTAYAALLYSNDAT